MKTCKDCTEFNAKTETCGCPMNAYPDVYSEYSDYSYTYARTAAESQACGFFMGIVVRTINEKQSCTK